MPSSSISWWTLPSCCRRGDGCYQTQTVHHTRSWGTSAWPLGDSQGFAPGSRHFGGCCSHHGGHFAPLHKGPFRQEVEGLLCLVCFMGYRSPSSHCESDTGFFPVSAFQWSGVQHHRNLCYRPIVVPWHPRGLHYWLSPPDRLLAQGVQSLPPSSEVRSTSLASWVWVDGALRGSVRASQDGLHS